MFLWKSRYYVLTMEHDHRVVRLSRTAEPFASAQDIASSFGEVMQALNRLGSAKLGLLFVDESSRSDIALEEALRLNRLGRARLGLLVDVRYGPSRNDPEFEDSLREARRPIFDGFRCVAILVKTEAGKLQVQRYHREDGEPTRVFHDEAAALAYLDSAAPSSRRPPT
jgi:hypothetical protein